MTKIDVYSGFLGAGKTTLIKKMLSEALKDEQVVLIENEFGEIGVDGGFLKEAGIEIREMNSGCICCSLVGDFATSLKEVMSKYTPDRILIEPSGVGKLSDVMKAVKDAIDEHDVILNSAVAVVDASKAKMYIKNFGEFFVDQIESAGTIVLSRTQNISEDKLKQAIELIREHNPKATIITTPWDALDAKDILETMEGAKDLEKELMEEVIKNRNKEEEEEECCCGHHHHHHHHDDDEHEHHHHHHDDDEECCCGHHHHDDDDDDDEDEHEHHHHHHHHDDDEECCCGHHHHDDDDDDEDEHDHHHHHHHDADEVFTSWGLETASAYSKEDIENILNALSDDETYGMVLRAKGMVPSTDGGFIYFDYVPEESNIRAGKPDVTGKFCVIGAKINEKALTELFAK